MSRRRGVSGRCRVARECGPKGAVSGVDRGARDDLGTELGAASEFQVFRPQGAKQGHSLGLAFHHDMRGTVVVGDFELQHDSGSGCHQEPRLSSRMIRLPRYRTLSSHSTLTRLLPSRGLLDSVELGFSDCGHVPMTVLGCTNAFPEE